MHLFLRVSFIFLLLLGTEFASGQQTKPPAAPNAQPKPRQMTIEVNTVVAMIKGTIIALQQANMTGNYSVLRDLGTPLFRERFDQTGLALVFYNLRQRKIDLTPVLFLAPSLTKNPEFNKDSELVLSGFFPTQPLQIQFELRFMHLDGIWRLAGIGVDAVQPPGAQASAAPPPAAQQQQAKRPKPKS